MPGLCPEVRSETETTTLRSAAGAGGASQSIGDLSGGETVRGLPEFLIPESEHWLDWFHITLRLTVMGQMIKGLVEVPESSNLTALLATEDELPSERVSIAELEKKRESM